MASLYGSFFRPELFASPYQLPEEHLIDLMRRNEMLFHARQAQKDAPDLETRRRVLLEFDKALFHIDARARASVDQGDFLALQYLREVFRLDNLEFFYLTLLLMGPYDPRFSGKTPDANQALKLFHFAAKTEEVGGYHIQRRQLEQKARFAFLNPDGSLDQRVCAFALQNGSTALESPAARTILPGDEEPLLSGEEDAQKLARAVSRDTAERDPLYICIWGQAGSGRTTRLKRTAQLLDVPIVLFDCGVSTGMKREEFFAALYTAGRETLLVQGVLAFKRFDRLLEEPETAAEALDIAGRFSGVVFVLAEDGELGEQAAGRRWLESAVTPPRKRESIALWTQALKGLPLSEPVGPAEMANKFTFTPAQIVRTGDMARNMALLSGKLDRRDLTRAAVRQVSHRLGDHADLICARHTWEQLVLGAREKEMLRSACDRVRYQHVVYDGWGFDERISYGKGVSMLFAGPPGTGKTMAAQVVANELGIELYKVNLSQVVSKYIGETEKNLNQVFNEAKKTNVILFFDETDAILGKRTEVRDSHDKNANLETAYLLQKMEEYDGITVMTTNYKENIDNAFFRRISYVIHFSLPDVRARKAIWQGIFPKNTPVSEEIDWEYLSRQFELSGGGIKNIALSAAFLAAGEDVRIGMAHILRAVQYEMGKQGKVMRREDYGEYGYLVK